MVSSQNWHVSASRVTTDFYNLFYHRFGAPTAADNAIFSDLTHVTQSSLPSNRTIPYYITGDMATSGNWSVGNGETLVFLVNGNLNGNLTIGELGTIQVAQVRLEDLRKIKKEEWVKEKAAENGG